MSFDPFYKHKVGINFDWDSFYTYWKRLATAFGVRANATMQIKSALPDSPLGIEYSFFLGDTPSVSITIPREGTGIRHDIRIDVPAGDSIPPYERSRDWCEEIHGVLAGILSSTLLPASRSMMRDKVLKPFEDMFPPNEQVSTSSPEFYAG